MFQWNKWFEGMIASGLVAAIMVIGPLINDGITKSELYMLLSAFLGGIVLYCKSHPPTPWNGVDRRDDNGK
jgi:hypothetical protein